MHNASMKQPHVSFGPQPRTLAKMTTALNLDTPTPTLDHYLCSLPEDQKVEFLTTMLNERLRLREHTMKASEDSNTLTPDANDPRRKRRRGVLSHPTVNVAGDRGVYALTSAMKDCLYGRLRPEFVYGPDRLNYLWVQHTSYSTSAVESCTETSTHTPSAFTGYMALNRLASSRIMTLI